MKDKNGKELKVGQNVQVPEPNDTDIHNFEFVGYITDIIEENNTVIIEDGDSDFFEIESERLIIIE